MAEDIALSGGAAYVGPDDHRAGRVAGDLMGRLLPPIGGRVIMLRGSDDMRGHRAREAGFREVLGAFYPSVALRAVFDTGEDPERPGLIVQRALRDEPNLRGIYQSTTGTLAIVEALRRLERDRDTVVIVHELTGNRRGLPRERAIDAVIDQNPSLEAQLAVETMARLLGRLEASPRPWSPTFKF